ncbi:hypothetical protein Cni_G17374 [Canna indica]|uniref:GTD-binding domain-containing protein n=1 Tax=Canna indica TaxID=4628 RepID=A0AAQ3KMJ8_9LILI|nr:hypothetical protein Cni_G17374 [Canna indica]
MDERKVAIAKEVTHHYIIMRNLYMELEKEREASATAASEALSMILKLQNEKAAEKMEACQYKRMAEEKMQYAQQCLTTLQEAMQEKEFENSILKHEIQLYKTKLLSNGISDVDHGDCTTSEDLSSYEDSTLMEKISLHDHEKRNIPLPSIGLCRLHSEVGSDENSHLPSSVQTNWKIIGEYTDLLNDKNKEVTDLFLESEEVNGKVRYGLTPGRDEGQTARSNSSLISGEVSSCCSLHSALTSEVLYRSKHGTRSHLCNGSASNLSSHNQIEYRRNSLQVCVHDIFEVPESDKYCTSSEPSNHLLEKSKLETKTSVATKDLVPQETAGFIFRDNGFSDRVFTSTEIDSGISSPITAVSSPQPDKLSTTRKGEMLKNNPVHVDTVSGTSILQNDFENIKCQLQKMECGKMMKMEDYDWNVDQLKLLRGIYEQLNTIEGHLNNDKSKKCSQHDESQLVSVMEAFLSFSI